MDLFLVFHQLHHFTTMIFMCVCVYAYCDMYVCVSVHMCEWECMHATVHMWKTENNPGCHSTPPLCWDSIFVSLLGAPWASRDPSDSHCSSTDVCYHDQCYEGSNSDTHTCISSLPTKSSRQSYRPIIFLLRQEESILQDNSHSVPCPWSF